MSPIRCRWSPTWWSSTTRADGHTLTPVSDSAAVFVSHGPPTLVLDDLPAGHFLAGLGRTLERPAAVLCVSAHWTTGAPAVSTAHHPETIHDFFGFPDALYTMRYPAPGAPRLAARVVEVLAAAGMDCAGEDRGLDHGAWVPLMLMYPDAQVPVASLSVQPGAGAQAHLALGRALAPLCGDGVLILGSGASVHNLGQARPGDGGVPDWAQGFDDWLAEAVEAGDGERLAAYRSLGPGGAMAHPTDEHLLPLLVCAGAGGGPGRVLHRSFTGRAIGMAADAFH